MFGTAGKKYADQIASQLESRLQKSLTSKTPQSTEQATETLGKVHGRRRALFVGINYFGQKGELRGCINDVKNISDFLTENYDIDEFLVLTDDQKDPKSIPTRANILNAFRWLREGAKAGDSLIFHFTTAATVDPSKIWTAMKRTEWTRRYARSITRKLGLFWTTKSTPSFAAACPGA